MREREREKKIEQNGKKVNKNLFKDIHFCLFLLV
jgi:hypothetical protein